MAYFWRFLKKISILLLIVIGVVVIGVTYYIEFQLPDIAELSTIQLQVPLQILSHDGKLIAEYGEKRRIPVSYAKIPPQLIQAVLATEDQRYFQHPGIDIPGLVRASMILIATGKKVQGGSTITMQVARSFYLNPRKTFGRKLREILLALKIDHKLSKQKILELYLNKIFLGNRAYGVGAAAQIYYGKTLDQLTLDQYAMLAGLPKAPSALNPLANPEAAKKRRDHVLLRMLEVHYIDEAAYKKAIDAPLNAHYHELQTQVKAPYVAELVRQQAEQMYGDDIYTDGYYIYTTIDSHLQELANQSVRSGLLAYDQRHGYRGPENNLGTPNLGHMQEWEKTLSNIPVIGSLEPAAVVDMTNKSVTVLRANGNLAVIPWQGLSWARPQVNANYLGPKPHSASDILKLGDQIRIMSSNQGWRLAQIPKAEASMVTLNPWDGAILALVGGFDFQRSNFNRVTTAERQPGSSFKPFIYSAALDQGYTLATVINDAPIVVENPTDNSLWRPQNDEKRFFGPTRLREGLIHSLNLVSIRLLDQITTPYAVNFAQRFGFGPSQLPPTLSLALGTASVTPLQMATGYSVFANGGFKIVPFAIDSIRNSQDQIIYQAKPLTVCRDCSATQQSLNNTNAPHAPRVISAQNAFLITSALRDVIQHGTAIVARGLKRNDLAGKTGTTQNQMNAWFVGYNPDYVTLAWVGFDQPQSLHEYGNQAALPIWMDFMHEALRGKPDRPLDQPSGIVSIKIDPFTGKRAAANDPVARFEFFMTPYVPDDDSKSAASPAEQPATQATAAAPAATAPAPATENAGLY